MLRRGGEEKEEDWVIQTTTPSESLHALVRHLLLHSIHNLILYLVITFCVIDYILDAFTNICIRLVACGMNHSAFVSGKHPSFFFFFFLCLFICFVLFCFVLFCFVLFCFVLFCFVLFCFVLFCFVLFCFVLFCFVLFVLFCFVLFCFSPIMLYYY